MKLNSINFLLVLALSSNSLLLAQSVLEVESSDIKIEAIKYPIINPDSISIVRDKWGVPHIYAKTDAEVAYGLAWATAEDAFPTMQDQLLGAKGLMGKVKGKEGAIVDFFSHSIGARDIVEEKFDSDLSPDFKRYLNGFVQGVNAYSQSHPEEIRSKKLFPVTSKDVLTGYVFSLSVISYAHKPVKKIIQNEYDHVKVPMGSNAFAMNSEITKDNYTYLNINPHQPLEGPFSFYEAHLNSEEGLNILGTLYPGGTSVFMGSNENLGWTHTYNGLDLVDVFKLEMHPKDKLKYKFDDEWKELEVRPVALRAKVKKWLTVPVRKKSYWSIYGPTYKSKNGDFYSIRFGANMDIRVAEQWYWMNKAKNYTEFMKAVNMQALARFNIVYADKYDTIMYMSNGLIPIRDPSYDWKGVVPGNTSTTLWKEFYPVDSLPRIVNPECGFVFNTNNTPFNATCDYGNMHKMDFHTHMGFKTQDNNRSVRFREIMEDIGELDFARFKEIKWDYYKPKNSNFIKSLEPLMEINPDDYPEISDAVKLIQRWDRSTKAESKEAAISYFTISMAMAGMGRRNGHTMETGIHLSEEVWVKYVKKAKDFLLKHHGKIELEWGDVQRVVCGDKDYPVSGYPDVLPAVHTTKYGEGKLKMVAGEAYIQLTKFTPDGPVIESLLNYGNSDRPDSPHYNDQMDLFINQKTKKMTIKKEEVYKSAVRVYNPK